LNQPHRQPSSPMRKKTAAFTAVASAATLLLLAACGGGGGGGGGIGIGVGVPPPAADNGRGSVVTDPPEKTAALTATQFTASLQASDQGKALLQVAGTPKCGVDLRYLEYRTIGANNEATNATAAIMVPTGSDVACSGQRPVVLYAHGTTAAKAYNLAKWTDSTQAAAGEGLMVAAMFAAQGYIVVAPNYAGYDKSTLPYTRTSTATSRARTWSTRSPRRARPSRASARTTRVRCSSPATRRAATWRWRRTARCRPTARR